MSQLIEKGYFVDGWGKGGLSGPIADLVSRNWRTKHPENPGDIESEDVKIVYGVPDLTTFEHHSCVSPIEKGYRILRYSDPDERGHVYVGALDVDASHEAPKNWSIFEATPNLHDVFDKLVPEWEYGQGLERRRNRRALVNALQKAGMTYTEGLKDPANWKVVKSYIRVPRPSLVPVVELDHIFEVVDKGGNPVRAG